MKHIIQPDARGRIQLPKEFRNHELFELSLLDDSTLLLHPLETKRKSVFAVWEPKKVSTYFDQHLLPAIKDYCVQQKAIDVLALALFGSRSRDDFLNTSDMDIAVFVKKIPNMSQRSSFAEALQKHVAPQIKQLKLHNTHPEISLVFIQENLSQERPPSLYLSIANDAKAFYDPQKAFHKWKSEILSLIKKNKIKRTGSGKTSVWKQEKNHG